MMAGANSLQGVLFDGVNDYLARTTPLSNISASAVFTVSAWVKFTVGGTVLRVSNQTGGQIFAMSVGPTAVAFAGAPASFVTSFQALYDTPINNGKWRHVLLSVNTANAAQRHLLIDGVPVSPTWNPYAASSIAFDTSQSRTSIGAVPIANNQKYSGSLAFLYFKPVYFNLTDPAQVAKFITAEREPAQRNANGSWGAGSGDDGQPTLWFSGGPPDFVSNKGNGGSFALNGALDASTGSIEIGN